MIIRIKLNDAGDNSHKGKRARRDKSHVYVLSVLIKNVLCRARAFHTWRIKNIRPLLSSQDLVRGECSALDERWCPYVHHLVEVVTIHAAISWSCRIMIEKKSIKIYFWFTRVEIVIVKICLENLWKSLWKMECYQRLHVCLGIRAFVCIIRHNKSWRVVNRRLSSLTYCSLD